MFSANRCQNRFFRLTLLLALLGSPWITFRSASAADEQGSADESGAASTQGVAPGVEVLVNNYAKRLADKRVGILTNPTGVDRNLVSTIDRIRALPGVKVLRLFAPEHGIRGGYLAGENVDETRDPVSGLPVISLHGASRRPPADALKDLDIVLYDIQDVGHRTYTFISTLAYMMDACATAGVEVWVLDRPDPLGGNKVGGPLLDDANRSFIGVYNIPQVYGLTPGEWAKLYKTEHLPNLRLTIIPMQGWKRGMTYGDLGWVWVPPSQHIPRWESSLFYAMTGTLGEAGVVSEGVGTPLPFEQVGAPWINGPALADALTKARLPGVLFRATGFRPRYGLFNDQTCQGVQIHLVDPKLCEPARVSQTLLRVLASQYPDRHLFQPAATETYQMFVKALGDSALARALATAGPYEPVDARIARQLQEYQKRREKILIYH